MLMNITAFAGENVVVYYDINHYMCDTHLSATAGDFTLVTTNELSVTQ